MSNKGVLLIGLASLLHRVLESVGLSLQKVSKKAIVDGDAGRLNEWDEGFDVLLRCFRRMKKQLGFLGSISIIKRLQKLLDSKVEISKFVEDHPQVTRVIIEHYY